MRKQSANIDLPPETLGKLLNNASACAAALLLVGADQFTVCVGDLSRTAFDQMRLAMNKYWPASTQHNLNRYIGLNLDERFYFLFAKFLPQSDYLLCLVFVLQTPLVRIRQDMTDVMRHVLQNIRSQVSKNEGLEQSLQFVLKPYPAPEPERFIPLKPAGWRVEPEEIKERVKGEAVPDQNFVKPPDSTPEWRRVPDNASLHASSSSPQLDESSSGELWVPLDEVISRRERPSDQEAAIPDSKPVSTSSLTPGKNTSKGIPDDWQPLEEASQPEPDLVRLFHEDFDLKKMPNSLLDEDYGQKQPSTVPAVAGVELDDDETKPHLITVDEEFDQIKLSDITFYLVPRQDRHYLLGELAQRLRGWFPGICEIYGWQLDHLSLRPDYIKWRLRDFPDALIHEMLEIVRERTSERIFRVFPNLQQGNPTKDFWSPGYLVDRQNQDFSTQVLIAHVAKGRTHSND